MKLCNKNRKIYVLINNSQIDSDFWIDLDDKDLEEAIIEYVRNCIDIFEPID